MTSAERLHAGDRVRLVSNPVTRKYGQSCHVPGYRTAFEQKVDCVVWPGELGTVVKSTYTLSDGTLMAHWYLEFARDRRITLYTGEPEKGSAEFATFYTDRDAEDFRRAPKARKPAHTAPQGE